MSAGSRSIILAVLLCAGAPVFGEESTCFGTVGNGRLEQGVKLPVEGKNFEPYSVVGTTIGRTYVHSRVHEAIVAAYAALASEHAKLKFVYGETGWAGGGRLKPHRTHQNGTSVDFMVPVRNEAGESVPLPRGFSDRYGYDLEFDASGRLSGLRIDFEAVGQHLYELHRAAKDADIGIRQVIFDSQYLPALYGTKRGEWIRKNVTFMVAKPWIRHDEHYHVDFAVACRPLPKP